MSSSHDPSVRFFRDSDGVRVAYSVHGQGPPVISAAWWVSHVEEDWKHSGFRRFFSALAEHHTVIRYDRPGAGLSDRDRDRIDLASEVKSLTALVDHLGFDRLALLGIACAGPPSICYAAAHPERVSHLVLFGSYVRGSDVGTPEMRDALQGLVRAHWGIGAKALADLFHPDLDADERNALGEAQRRAASAEMSARLLALTFDADASSEADHLRCPTLVLHRRGDQTIPLSAGREAAASLPGASLQTLDGSEHLPWLGDVDAASAAMLAFLGGRDRPSSAPIEGQRCIRKVGSLWELTFGGQTIHLADSRGLADLALLLSQPGKEVHVMVLRSGSVDGVEFDEGVDPVLDETALRAYRSRLQEIDEEIEEAQAMAHVSRLDRLQEERDAVSDALGGALGLGGRVRRLNDRSEKARKAVTARIRASLKKIDAAHPELGEHLRTSSQTGTYCSYAPENGEAWSVD